MILHNLARRRRRRPRAGEFMATSRTPRSVRRGTTRTIARVVAVVVLVIGCIGVKSSSTARVRANDGAMTTTKAGSRDLSSRRGEDVVGTVAARRAVDASMSMGSEDGVRVGADSLVSDSAHEELFVPESWTQKHPAVEASASTTSTCASPGAERERALGDEAFEATPCGTLDALRPKASAEFGVLVIAGGDVEARIASAKTSGARAVIVAARNEADKRACVSAGVPVHLPTANGDEFGWATTRWVLKRGHIAVLASSDVKLGSNPLRDVPREGADVSATVRNDGQQKARVVGMSDPKMGWSQYSQSMVVPLIRTSFVVFRPTRAALSLVDWLASDKSDYDGTEDAFTDEVLLPSHDGRQRAGVTFRMLDSACFGAKGRVATIPDGKTRWDGVRAHENALVSANPTFTSAKAHVSRPEKCGIVRPSDRVGPSPRALRYIAKPDGDYPVACDDYPDLCEVVRKVARNREVLAAVSNKNIFHMLSLYIDGLKRTGIENYVIVALDKETAEWCKERDVPYYHRELQSITGSTDNHATSGLKFKVLNEFVSTGTSVLLSDVDVVWMQDPFADGPGAKNDRLIYRDVDVEGMTDGWDDDSAYGFSWNGQRRLMARNSGLFFVAATHETQSMLSRLADRMASEKGTWDQTAYNEEQVYLWGQANHKVYSGTSQRIMNYMCFQNSKYLFRYMRFDTDLYPNHRPASVHINYHPEKPDRMVSVIAQYWDGKASAIDVWNWGEGRKDLKECVKRPNDNGISDSKLARILVAKTSKTPGKWGGSEGIVCRLDGTVVTPWNEGKWGVLSESPVKFYMDFGGTHHVLTLTKGSAEDGETGAFEFTSNRCTDLDEVRVVI